MLKSKRKVPFDVKSTIINTILELLAPKRCERCGVMGSVLCDCCKKYLRETNPGYMIKEIRGFSEIIVGGIKEGMLSKIVKMYKYGCNREIAPILADIVKDRLLEIVEDEKRLGRKVVIVPLPTITKHIRERGFDHIKLIAKEFAGIVRVEYLISRYRNTVQVGKGADERLKQAKLAYQMKTGAKCEQDCKYILFDDVWTTGGSMCAALETMKKSGAKEVGALLVMSNDYIEISKNLP